MPDLRVFALQPGQARGHNPPMDKANVSPLSLWQWGVAIALLLALFFQLARAALRNSATFDEGQHISRGYVYLRTGDLRFQRFRSAHPPGMASLEAALLLLVPGMPEPASLPGWAETDTVIFAKQLVLDSPFIEPLMFAARLPVMLVTMLLAAFVFRWASDLSRVGAVAGLVALGLCAFDPNIVAHGMIAATDAGVTAFSFIALYWLWRSLRRPSPGVLAVAGLALGLALVTKMTALLLLPVSALLTLVMGMANQRRDYFARVRFMEQITARLKNFHLRRLLGLVVMAGVIYIIGFLVMWAVYRFELGELPGLPVPIPAPTHFSSLVRAQEHLDVGHPTFLMGQASDQGWWYYFPLAFLIKTPLPLLIMLFLATFRFLWKGQGRVAFLPLIVFVVAHFAVTLLSTVNIGYRHLLPILPFTFVFIGSQSVSRSTQHIIPSLPWDAARIPFCVSRFTFHVLRFTFYALLLTWYIIGTLAIFPNYLTFFNELIGGPKNGYKYLVDSNLDWGQSLVELRAYMHRNHLDRISLSSTGYVDPAVYGIKYDPLPPMPKPQYIFRFDPQPGQYYIGAHNLQIGSPIDHDVFGWFREREPDGWIGNAILVYDVPQRPPGQWAAQCTTPQVPLEPKWIARGVGRNDLRLIYFDCQTSWVYPANMPGWYIIGDEAEVATLPAALRREFRTGGLNPGSRFTLYRLDALPEFPGVLKQVRVASGDGGTQGIPVQAPLSVGPLVFRGFRLDRAQVAPGQTVTLTAYWQVASGTGRLVSLMAHLITADGADASRPYVIANGDGLGVAVENWQPGDVIVQRHALAIPHGTPPGVYQVQTGLYAFDDLSRFDVTSDGVTLGNRLLLATVEVK